jgi:hypothetical protein
MNMNLENNKTFLVVSSTGAKAWVKVSSVYPKTLDLDWNRVDGPMGQPLLIQAHTLLAQR